MKNFNLLTYLQEVKLELSKVTWPSKQLTINMTLVVIIVSILVAIYLGVLDFVFARLMAFILG